MLEDTRNDYKINEKQSVIWEHEDLAQVSISNQLLLSWSQGIFLVDISLRVLVFQKHSFENLDSLSMSFYPNQLSL